MGTSLHPRLINDPFSDPGLFISLLYRKRALLFDLGDLHGLSPRDLMKVSHVFVTHAHMDHFVGFDRLLRILLGRERELILFGPPEFSARVEGKLAGYTWNLVDEYETRLTVRVTEVGLHTMKTKTYLCEERFARSKEVGEVPFDGTLWEEPGFRVEGALLDHRTPCLGYALIESFSININKAALQALNLPVGPWLTRFKKALHNAGDLGQPFVVTWEEKGRVEAEKPFILGELARKIARISPGQKIAYLSDMLGSPENLERAEDLVRYADSLYVEAPFLEKDRAIAEKKYHLTAKEAGSLARRAGVKRLTLFHFSPRYTGGAEALVKEAMDAFHNR